MSSSNGNGKALRFASFVRVSTEKQEKRGDSLRTQRTQNERDVESQGGRIVACYGGQEHGTPGWEKQQIDRLIADAGKGKFDAVIVAYVDRWSRDNAKSKEGLDIFRKHGIRFFVGSMEMDLFDPQHCLILGMNAEIGEFFAHQQAKKSVENRIHRAKSGMPTCGKLPFGRKFVREGKGGRWEIDAKAKRMVEDCARRYLAGEPMPKLAAEYGVNHSNLHKILTRRCGTRWVQHFRPKRSRIDESVETPIPPLLPDDVIRAVRRKAEANKTYLHGQAKHTYLLGRMVFCERCGCAMFGQTNRKGRRYYRHARSARVKKACRHAAWVPADEIEAEVIWRLFDDFGNPQAVERAIAQATPNRERIDELREHEERIVGLLAKVKASRDSILRMISRGVITDVQAEKELDELKAQESGHVEELERIRDGLANLPSPRAIKQTAKKVAGRFIRYCSRPWAKIYHANDCLERMTPEEKRTLVQIVFGGKAPDGRRMGVYVEIADESQGRRRRIWRYAVRGHLIEDWGRVQSGKFPDTAEPLGGPRQKELLRVTKSSTYLRGKSSFAFALNGTMQEGGKR